MYVPSEAWKLLLALTLGAAVCASACAHAPRRSVPLGELIRLVASALALYGVGAGALLSGHTQLAQLLCASGIAACALAAWLSRGIDSEDPPSPGEDPADEWPPPEPDGVPRLDWAAFEREFRAYCEKSLSGTR